MRLDGTASCAEVLAACELVTFKPMQMPACPEISRVAFELEADGPPLARAPANKGNDGAWPWIRRAPLASQPRGVEWRLGYTRPFAYGNAPAPGQGLGGAQKRACRLWRISEVRVLQ